MTASLMYDVNIDLYRAANNTMISDDATIDNDDYDGDDSTVDNDDTYTDDNAVYIHDAVYIHRHVVGKAGWCKGPPLPT